MARSSFYFAIPVVAGLFVFAALARHSVWGIRTGPDATSVSSVIKERLQGLRQRSPMGEGQDGHKTTDPLIVFRNGRPVWWSAAINFPVPAVQSTDTLLVMTAPAGVFLQDWRKLDAGEMEVGIITLVREFLTPEGKVVRVHDEAIFGNALPVILPAGMGKPVTVDGQVLFSLQPSNLSDPAIGYPVWLLFLSGIALLIWWVGRLWNSHVLPWWYALTALGAVLLAVRIYMILAGLPGTGSGLELFDPAVFASSRWNDSAGNFFLNHLALLLFSLAFLQWSGRASLLNLARSSVLGRNAILVLLTLASILVLSIPVWTLRTVYQDSILNPDLTRSIHFSASRLIMLSTVIISAASGWALLQPMMRWMFLLLRRAVTQGGKMTLLYWLCGSVPVCFIPFGYFDWQHRLAIVMFFCWLAILAAGFLRKGVLTYRQVPGLITVFLLSFVLASGIGESEDLKQQHDVERYAATLVSDRDDFGEYMLFNAGIQVASDPFLAGVAESPFADKGRILRKLNQYHFAGYFSRYRIRSGYYGPGGDRMDGNLPDRLEQLIPAGTRLIRKERQVSLYHMDRSRTPDGLGKDYILVVGVGPGQIAISADLNPLEADQPWYSRLDPVYREGGISTGLNYAVVSGGQVIFRSPGNDFVVEYAGGKPVTPSENEFSRIIPLGQDRLLVVSGHPYSWDRILTNFSFYLFIFLAILSVNAGAGLIISVVRGEVISYASRIRFYLFISFLLPVMVLSLVTIRKIALEREGQVSLVHRKEVTDVAGRLGRLMSPGSGNPLLQENPEVGGAVPVEGFILYGLEGKRVYSSRNESGGLNFLPQLMNPVALKRMEGGQPFTAVRETIAGTDYQATYAPVVSGVPPRPVAWLHVPYFGHYQAAEQLRIDVILAILPSAVLVIIIYLFISFLMVERLTRPLKMVTQSIRRSTLADAESGAEGNRKDEIATLMATYNRMLINLERSREELLARQRESEWRDMARRVAHEIRNPLTPIRLQLQMLRQKLGSGVKDPNGHIATIDAVLAQTEILSGIAESFSSVARFPVLRPIRFDLVGEARRTLSLFEGNEDGTIEVLYPAEPIMVEFDPSFFSRVLSNLVINSFQSKSESTRIVISFRDSADKVVILVQDDGPGIPDQIAGQVFEPRFTTKETGSGLGLTIAKQGLEQGGGSIRFEPVNGGGTCFYVEIPKPRD